MACKNHPKESQYNYKCEPKETVAGHRDGVSPGSTWHLFIYSTHTCYISTVGKEEGQLSGTGISSIREMSWGDILKQGEAPGYPSQPHETDETSFQCRSSFIFFSLVKFLFKKQFELITWDKWRNKTSVLVCTCLFTRTILTRRGICGFCSALSWKRLRPGYLDPSLLPLDSCFSPNKALLSGLTDVKEEGY